jgi:hypothetical protein
MSPTSFSYHSRLQKGGALLDDMRLLVRSWDASASPFTATGRQSILGEMTRSRSRDTIVRAFAPRFLNRDPPAVWRIVRCLEDRNVVREACRTNRSFAIAHGLEQGGDA